MSELHRQLGRAHLLRCPAALVSAILVCAACSVGVAAALLGQTAGSRGAEVCAYKFLVLDDSDILDSQNLKRRVNQAVKHPDPVLRLDAPWHGKDDRIFSVNVLYDGEERLFKMWYGIERWKGGAADGALTMLAYATSKDGIEWLKPKLGLFQIDGSRENNFVMPEMEAFNCSIVKDTSDIAARRYKMVFSTGGMDADWARFHSPLSVAYSHDGLRWERPRHVNPILRGVSDNIWSFFFDPDRRKYVLLTRRVPNAPRDVSQYESFDLVNWEDKGRVLVSGDARDPIEVGTEIYYLSPFRYENLYLGALNCLYTDPVSEAYGSFHRSPGFPKDRMGLMDIQLAYSRDGVTWTRPTDRSPIVPIGKPGELDQGMVYSARDPIVRAGDTWIYYIGNKWSHNWWEWLDSHDPQKGIREIASVMLARMPEDHFVSLDAGETEGRFQSKPWGPHSRSS